MKLFPSTSTHVSARSARSLKERSLKSKMAQLCLSAAFPLLLIGGGSVGAAELIESSLQNNPSEAAATSSMTLAAGDLYVSLTAQPAIRVRSTVQRLWLTH